MPIDHENDRLQSFRPDRAPVAFGVTLKTQVKTEKPNVGHAPHHGRIEFRTVFGNLVSHLCERLRRPLNSLSDFLVSFDVHQRLRRPADAQSWRLFSARASHKILPASE